MAAQSAHVPPLDVVGVGFGPSNLALAIALREYGDEHLTGPAPRAAFLERQRCFGWHRGMLLEGATMQVSFLKDLATLRNPNSRYSFLSYLHARGRLVDFINHKILYPTRLEFHDYMEWVAAHFADQVSYGRTVVGVQPCHDGDRIVALDVVHAGPDGECHRTRTRNLVLATGLQPAFPADVQASERVWHSSELLGRLERLTGAPPRRITVVGAGQSAAEATAHLHQHFPDAEVRAVFSRFGYSVADDSPFANRIFDPDAVDTYFTAPADVKKMLLDYHSNTNYSVVDLDLTEELYRRFYAERVSGRQRLMITNVSRVRRATDTGSGVRLTVESLATGETSQIDSDIVVCATGYRPSDPALLLGEVAGLCERDGAGQLEVGRDYRVRTADALRCGIYLQGATEHAHGISAGLLSNTAVRAGEIVRSIVAHEAETLPGAAAPEDWTDLDDPAYLIEAAPARRQA